MEATLSPAAGRHASVDVPWRAARNMAALRASVLGVERIAARAATGRVLAADIRATTALPGCDVSAMDGYAVAGTPPWTVIGRVFAGNAGWSSRLTPGTGVEIMTGAPVPAGARAVIPYECCDRDGDVVRSPQEGKTHIRTAGEDAMPGDVLVPAGRPVTPAVLGAAAQAGVDLVSVYRRPRVRVVVTGDEIVRAGVPAPGQVRDALGPVVTALVDRAGGTMVDQHQLPDDGEILLDALRYTSEIDVVVVTGSSSVGAADHLHDVLGQLEAQWHVDGVRCRPGHPQVLAQMPDGTWVVGLPGNPFAGLVAAMTLLDPLIMSLGGRSRRGCLRLPIIGDVRAYVDGTRLVPVRIDNGFAEVIAGGRPASMRAVASADALAIIESDWARDTAAELLPLF